ncbi:MAG: protein kinase [Thermoanaerobaculia bacterium]|nr:protein kinase [Thermoanaerobaculia bacterium]
MTDTFIGRSLGKYEVESKLGQGGMGMVYRGRQRSLNRAVAIKVLPAQMAMDTDFVERFRQEAQVIAGLQHENIVHVYDIDRVTTDSGEPIYFIVMEYVDGFNLRQRPRREQPMDWQKVRAVGLPVARALDYAHRRGIVHRDIKPANVMETRDGKVKLMDFGIAKSAGGVKTATGSVLGTPEYMAPEQAQTGQVTPRSDIYSLGVLLYELATGRLPFVAAEPFAIALKHISEAPEPPSRLVPEIPPWLERVILRAMEKDPGLRFADAAAMAHALELAGADASSSPSQVPTERPGPAVLPLDLAPTVATPASGVDPAAPTLETPAFGSAGADSHPSADRVAGAHPPTVPAPPATPPPIPPVSEGAGSPPESGWGASGPLTSSRRPVAWWPVAAVVGVVAVVAAAAVGYFTLGGSEPAPEVIAADLASERDTPDLAAAERLLASGDLPSARRHLDAHLAGHPDDAAAQELDRRLRHAEESLAQALAAGDLLGELGDAPSELEEPDADRAVPADPDPEPVEDAVPPPVAERTTALLPDERVAPADQPEARDQTASSPTVEKPAAAPPEAVPAAPPVVVPSRPSLRELVRAARRHRANDEYHSLREVIEQIEARGPGRRDEELEKWGRKVEGWIEDREDDLHEEVEDLLDDFVDAVEEEDPDEMDEVWGEVIDARTSEFFRQWWQTYRKSEAKVELRSVDPWDHEAGFVAVVHLYGKKERGDDLSLVRSVTWRGRIRDRDGTRMIAPFPG